MCVTAHLVVWKRLPTVSTITGLYLVSEVMRFGEPLTLKPRQPIPNHEPRIFEAARQSVRGARAAKGEDRSAGEEGVHHDLAPLHTPVLVLSRLKVVPRAAHEREYFGRERRCKDASISSS